jgi:hypothetical protein
LCYFRAFYFGSHKFCGELLGLSNKKFMQSEEEKLGVYYSSLIGPEQLYLGIE